MAEFIPLDSADLVHTFWLTAVGAMTNAACALLGCFLVLRRMSLLGDALSHAVLPGLVVAFMLAGSLNIGFMLLGALAVGLLTTFLTQALHRGGVPADASMGVVFTSLFALGVLLISRHAHQVHIDADCVFQGYLEFASINTVTVAGWEVPRAILSIAPVLVLDVLFVLAFWKELKISSFDPALATSMGLSAGLMHYLLMGFVAATTVASFEAVGSILVVAMLIVPGATAHLLSDRLGRMVMIAMGVAVLAAVVGVAASIYFDTNTAGMMAVTVGIFYLFAAFLSPRYGIISKMWDTLRTTQRIVCEDLLAMLYRLEELSITRPMSPTEAVQAVGGGLAARWGLWSLAREGKISRHGAELRLSDSGRRRAAQLVRSHRLWEAYLVQYLGLPLDHVHQPAARMEHFISSGLERQIVAELSDSATDPHGRGIPREPGMEERPGTESPMPPDERPEDQQ